ncbi:MAG: c-type cytochrome [Rhodospirillales bacterium]|nr:c-type cytochrome [Rhodospirillales bacterium]
MNKGRVLAAILVLSSTLIAGTAMANDHAEKGKKVFKKCIACHTVTAGKNKSGPSLAGIFGRKAGTAEGYTNYKGLKGADWTWDEAELDGYLANPGKFTKSKGKKKASMTFKLKKKADRENVIAYIKTLK